jgi:hypothetical protein
VADQISCSQNRGRFPHLAGDGQPGSLPIPFHLLPDKVDYRTTPFPVPHLSGSGVNQALARAEQLKADLKAAQELLESGLVLSWGDERGLFVAGAFYLKEAFGRKCSGIHFLSELKRDNRVLTAVDDQNGSVYFL